MPIRPKLALNQLKPSERKSLQNLRRIEKKTRRPPWAVGASLVKANIDWMRQGEKAEISKFAKAHNLGFREAVKKYLEVARWIEHETAKEMKGSSKTGNMLPYATFLSILFPPRSSLAEVVRQFQEGRLPTFTKMNELEKEAYLNTALKEGEKEVKSAEKGIFNRGQYLHGVTNYVKIGFIGKILNKENLHVADLEPCVHETLHFYGKISGKTHTKITAEERQVAEKILEKLKKNPPKF